MVCSHIGTNLLGAGVATVRIVGCVPVYRNRETVAAAVASLLAQTVPLTEVIVVDDGSPDDTVDQARAAGARVVPLGQNQGRGAARARCVDEAGDADFLVSVDGTQALAPDFVERTLPWMQDPQVAAAYGGLRQENARTVADRWRARHLFRQDEPQTAGPVPSFISGGFLGRVSALRAVGNFDASRRHSEDAEMGERLQAAGYRIISEPSAWVLSQTSNTVPEVLERWARWNGGADPRFRWQSHLRLVWYALKVMVAQDLRARDPGSAFLSLLAPHLLAWRSMRR